MLLKTLLALTLCVIGSTQAQKTPVFLWGATTDAKHSLATISETDFTALLRPLAEKHTIIAFLEDNLTARDLSCHKADTTKSCFAHLRGVTPKTYYASVEQPLEALRSVAKTQEDNSVDAAGKLALPIDLQPGKVIFVSFDDDDDEENERGATLELHDAAIKGVSQQLTGDVVYLYLSSNKDSSSSVSSVSRVRRSTAATMDGYIFNQANQFLLFFSSFNYTTGEADAKSSAVVFDTMVVTNTTNNNVFNVTLNGSNGKTLQFSVLYQNSYFSMHNVTYDNVPFYYNEMTAPVTFSYHCSQLVLTAKTTSANPNGVIVWNNLQFQAPFGSNTKVPNSFGDSWDCVYFFTPGILSGIFVAIVLLFVLFSGICWIMDINTMDRFDDPKGKTITINAD